MATPAKKSEVDPELAKEIAKTQESLGNLITRPILPEQYLKRPPFKFLHDIVTNIIRETGFMRGVFDPSELNFEQISSNVETKRLFLNKLIITAIEATGESVNIRPSKILAGQDPKQTNNLLQLLGDGIRMEQEEQWSERNQWDKELGQIRPLLPHEINEMELKKKDAGKSTSRRSTQDVGGKSSETNKTTSGGGGDVIPDQVTPKKEKKPEKSPSNSNTTTTTKNATDKKSLVGSKSTSSTTGQGKVKEAVKKQEKQPEQKNKIKINSSNPKIGSKSTTATSKTSKASKDPKEPKANTTTSTSTSSASIAAKKSETSGGKISRNAVVSPYKVKPGKKMSPKVVKKVRNDDHENHERIKTSTTKLGAEKGSSEENLKTQEKASRKSTAKNEIPDDARSNDMSEDKGASQSQQDAPKCGSDVSLCKSDLGEEDEEICKCCLEAEDFEDSGLIVSHDQLIEESQRDLKKLKSSVEIPEFDTEGLAEFYDKEMGCDKHRPPTSRNTSRPLSALRPPPRGPQRTPRVGTAFGDSPSFDNSNDDSMICRPLEGKVTNVILDREVDETLDESFEIRETPILASHTMMLKSLTEAISTFASVKDNLTSADMKGLLVNQIVTSQNDMQSGFAKKFERGEEKEAEMQKRENYTAEIEKLKGLIQDIAKNANPLGRLLEFTCEDVHVIQRELGHWQEENHRLDQEIERTKLTAQKSLQPIKQSLEEVESKIKAKKEDILSTKLNILKLESRINSILNGLDRVVPKDLRDLLPSSEEVMKMVGDFPTPSEIADYTFRHQRKPKEQNENPVNHEDIEEEDLPKGKYAGNGNFSFGRAFSEFSVKTGEREDKEQDGSGQDKTYWS